MNVLIIGGTGEFGSFYAGLLKKRGFKVFIKGKDDTGTEAFCKEKKFQKFDENYKKIDAIIVTVPNKIAPQVIEQVSKKIVKGTLICDFCSVKSRLKNVLEKNKGKGFEIASIHPMHGPRVNSIANYPIITIKVEVGKNFSKIMSFFEKEGGVILESGFEEHDKVLSLVQGLTHYTQIVSAETMREMGIDFKKARTFSSPNFELFISLISRVLLQNPSLYAQIQTENPYNKEMREKFCKKASYLKKICEKNDPKHFEKEIISSAKIFNSIDTALQNSDLAVSALKFVSKTLREKTGKKILVKNISTDSYHYGLLEEVNSKEVVIKERKNDTIISIEKIRPITGRETLEWKIKNIPQKQLDYSFLVPKETRKEFVLKIFNNLRIADFGVIDEFENENFPEDKKSITIRAVFFEDEDKEKIDSEILETIKEMGFESR